MRLLKTSLFLPLFVLALSTSGCSTPDEPEEVKKEPEPVVKEKSIPELDATKVSFVSHYSALATGKITSTGEASISEKGFVWGENSNPTKEDFFIVATTQNSLGEFSKDLHSLYPNRTYYVRSYAVNEKGTGYGKETSFRTGYQMEDFLEPESFASEEKFAENWSMFYPWGTDYNGGARMRKENVFLEEGGILRIEANRITAGSEPPSTWVGEIPLTKRDPWENHPEINYYSGAIHFNKTINVNSSNPYWVIEGEFQMPTKQGVWPAFSLVDASTSHNLINIVEFKGNSTGLFNAIGNSEDYYIVSDNEKELPDASTSWHTYKIILKVLDEGFIQIAYYVDGEIIEDWQWLYHIDRMQLHLVIHLQMEGASGSPGPETAFLRARNISVGVDPESN